MNELDKLFEEKLGNREVVPSAQSWETLESRLKGKKRKGLYWKLAVAASLILILSFFFLFQRTTTTSEEELSAQNTEEQQETTQAPLIADNQEEEELPVETEESVSPDQVPVIVEERAVALETNEVEQEKATTPEIQEPQMIETQEVLIAENEPEKELLVPVEEEAIASAETETEKKLPPITIEFRSGNQNDVQVAQAEDKKKKGFVKQIQNLAKEVKEKDISIGRLRDAKDDFLAFDKKKEKEEKSN